MANELEELFIAIKMKGAGGAKKVLRGLRKTIKSLVGDIKVFKANLSALAVAATFRGVSNSLKSLTREFKDFVNESISLAATQEEAVAGLQAAMKTAGDFTKESLGDLKEFASAMQDISIHGDELIIQQLSIAKAYGASNDQAKKLVEASIELSAATGKSLEESVRQIAKTLGGYAGELGEVLPQIKELTTEQLKAGRASEVLIKSFGGSSLKRMETFNAQTQSLVNLWGDMKELIGEPLLEVLLQPIKDLKADLNDMKPAFREFGQSLADAFKIVKRIFDSFGGNDLIGTALKKFGNFIQTMALLVEDFFFFIQGERSFIGSKLEGAGGIEGALEGLAFKAGEVMGKVIPIILKGMASGLGIAIRAAISPLASGAGASLDQGGRPELQSQFADLARREKAGLGFPKFAGFNPDGTVKHTTNNSDNSSATVNQTISIKTSQPAKSIIQEVENALNEFSPALGAF